MFAGAVGGGVVEIGGGGYGVSVGVDEGYQTFGATSPPGAGRG